MPRAEHGHLFLTTLFSYRLKFAMLTGAGVGVTGITFDVWRAKQGETPATQIVTAGAGRTITEVDATNMPGVYELQLQAADLDTAGALTLRVVDTGASAEDLILHLKVLPREALNIA